MARIRTIKPEFWTDDKIIALPYGARLFFIGLWNFADDFGFIEDKPDQLKLLIMPSEDRLDIHQTLDLLVASELVERYYSDEYDKTFLLIKNWSSHQKVDRPTKSKIYREGSKKANIPNWLRRKVAEKYGCKPGKSTTNECYFCGVKGSIVWSTTSTGEPSSWVSFTHEMSHLIPECKDGEMTESNIVLACRNCNRSMGSRAAFDWLFNGTYYTNQQRESINHFREGSREFESARDGKEGKGKEGKGKDKPQAADSLDKSSGKIEMPFDTPEFITAWDNWKEYKKKEYRFQYKSVQSEQGSLKELLTLSGGKEPVAIAIIQQSIAKGWKGLFELKDNTFLPPQPKTTDAVWY